MKRVVLDASAVVTFYDERPGADKVEDLIAEAIEGKKELLMSVVNWGEVFSTVWRGRGKTEAERIAAEIDQLPIEIVDADYALTKLAAQFRAQHKLHYTDCFAAALARLRQAVVATADKDFAQVERHVEVLWTTEARGGHST